MVHYNESCMYIYIQCNIIIYDFPVIIHNDTHYLQKKHVQIFQIYLVYHSVSMFIINQVSLVALHLCERLTWAETHFLVMQLSIQRAVLRRWQLQCQEMAKRAKRWVGRDGLLSWMTTQFYCLWMFMVNLSRVFYSWMMGL